MYERKIEIYRGIVVAGMEMDRLERKKNILEEQYNDVIWPRYVQVHEEFLSDKSIHPEVYNGIDDQNLKGLERERITAMKLSARAADLFHACESLTDAIAELEDDIGKYQTIVL